MKIYVEDAKDSELLSDEFYILKEKRDGTLEFLGDMGETIHTTAAILTKIKWRISEYVSYYNER